MMLSVRGHDVSQLFFTMWQFVHCNWNNAFLHTYIQNYTFTKLRYALFKSEFLSTDLTMFLTWTESKWCG